jgi:signal transduction histidine kinase
MADQAPCLIQVRRVIFPMSLRSTHGASTHLTAEEAVTLIARLDSIPEILDAMAELTGLRFTAVAHVTESTWTACAVRDDIDFGLQAGGHLELETTICHEIRQHRQAVIFDHASKHPTYSSHHTPRIYGIESYVSIPIILGDGSFFGTWCAIEPRPAHFDGPSLERRLSLYTKLIASQIDAELRRESAEAALLNANEAARLRDQFVAVLGHDLRNPLQSISTCADLLQNALPQGRERKMATHIRRSVLRMDELINNILDFARGQLGEGITAALDHHDNLRSDLLHVVSEVQTSHPERTIEVNCSLRTPFACDRRRIAQLLGNLVSNAVTHGAAEAPIRVSLRSDEEAFMLSVANAGTPIEPVQLQHLFQPFTRGTFEQPRQGLGLGLFIAAEIAKAHQGTLRVFSDAIETRFEFRMPIDLRTA